MNITIQIKIIPQCDTQNFSRVFFKLSTFEQDACISTYWYKKLGLHSFVLFS